MAKIPFTLEAWLKDKSKKVETRDGRLVHNIWQVKEPPYTNNRKAEVCALIDGEEDALVFFEGGRYLPTTKDTDSPFDLFIVTPEPELTEFEMALLGIINDAFDCVGYNGENAKIDAAKLLDLARKQLVEEQYTSDPRKTDLYKLGRAEALMDLPRWKKWGNGACGNGQGIPLAIVKRGLNGYELVDALGIPGEQYIMLSDLERLPGFKED